MQLEGVSSTLVAQVAAYAASHGLFAPPPRYVAVSGGVDSVVLLHVLVALGQRPAVLTCDHGLRPESAAEVEFVLSMAQGLGLEAQALRLGVRPGPDLASRARAARFAAWEALPPGDIALAHHLDDQAETTLDHLLRGAGAGGLAGMRPRRGRYVRPLLGVRRAEILRWAQQSGLSWVEDPSNLRGQRAALRREVMPQLERLRAGAAGGLARSAALLAQDDALLVEMAAPLRAEDGVIWAALAAAPAPLARRAVLGLVLDSGGAEALPSAVQLDAALALGRDGAGVNIPGGWSLVRDGERLRCLPPRPAPVQGQQGRYGLWCFEAQGPVLLRPPQAGERLGGVRVGRWMAQARISRGLRAYQPVVQRGDRAWIVGAVPLDPSPDGVHVRVWRASGASWPGGGPYEATI